VDVAENAAGLFPTDLAVIGHYVDLACLVASFSGRNLTQRRLLDHIQQFWNNYFRSPTMDRANEQKAKITVNHLSAKSVWIDEEQPLIPILEQFSQLMNQVKINVPPEFRITWNSGNIGESWQDQRSSASYFIVHSIIQIGREWICRAILPLWDRRGYISDSFIRCFESGNSVQIGRSKRSSDRLV
jgi:hypothetical protein